MINSPTAPLVKAFSEAMEYKLEQNRHKGNRDGWLKDHPVELIGRLKDELRELERALDDYADAGDPELKIHSKLNTDIVSECADIGNFAMMIADRCGQLVEDRGYEMVARIRMV